jgi:hypothetical protein
MEEIHIIKSRRKWGVYKRNGNKSLRNFEHRDLAFHYATRYDAKLIVHNSDGMVDFIAVYDDTNK